MVKHYFEVFSQVAPKQMEELRRLLIYADISVSPQMYSALTLIESTILGVVGTNMFTNFFDIDNITAFILGFICGIIVSFGALSVMADRKTKDIEENLPDTMLLIASNVRAGETIDWAITSALRHSYGPLRSEFDRVARDLASGIPVEDSFRSLAERNRSSILRNVVDLILFGMESGGNMSDLLTDISFEIRMTQTLKKEVDSQVAVYRAFFIIIILFVAPILLAISTNFLLVTKEFGERLSEDLGELPANSPMGVQGGMISELLVKIQEGEVGGQISVQDMYYFSYGLCTMSSIVASMLLGVIARGEERAGFKYIPVFLIISVLVYYYADQAVFDIMNTMFSGILE